MTTAEKTIKLGVVARSQYAALKEGIVKPQGASLDIVEVAPMPKLFDRMIVDLEFDVSEMAIVTYLQLKQLGRAFTALPIFPMRGFPQGATTYNVNSGITKPKDLEGKKIGVRAYAGTAGVWARGLLAFEYGVDHTKVTWVLTDIEHLDEIPNPSNTVNRKGDKLPDLITSGEIDAGIGVQGVDSPDVKPLIADANQATADWFAKTGVFPINNCIVVRDEVLAANPEIAETFFAAYKQAKSLYLQRLAAQGPKAKDEETDKRYGDIVGGDPLPIGIEANRKALEMVAQFSVDQGVISAMPNIDELFAPSTRNLS
jgi:4,5-dihydroxyphthalate decarboxylase